MSHSDIVFTLCASDRPGIVSALSDIVLAQGGSWLESSLTRLCGQFTGIVHVRVPAQNRDKLLAQLGDCSEHGIAIQVHDSDYREAPEKNLAAAAGAAKLRVLVEANDRAGIVDEIAGALADRQINVEKLSSSCESASMAGYPLFRARIKVRLPEGMDAQALEEILEGVSDDLMVSIRDGDEYGDE